ncbi:uncharacterized protein METZ01_LOCUS340567, partial [marine metagenome]
MATKKNKITVVDYGMGNLFNVTRALELLECDVCLTGDINTIIKSEKLLLPGVGAFEDGMRDLKENNLDSAIKEYVQTDKPLLGICLGMQLLMTTSEENGNHDGLDLIKGKVVRFKDPKDHSNKYKIPQIGWNELLIAEKKQYSTRINTWDGSILDGLDKKPFMYFLHSYFVVPEDEQVYLAETSYGRDLFCSVVQKNQIFGCQFHPERS